MKLSTRDDIEAPLSFVFDSFADTESWERAAMRRGAEVTRTAKVKLAKADKLDRKADPIGAIIARTLK